MGNVVRKLMLSFSRWIKIVIDGYEIVLSVIRVLLDGPIGSECEIFLNFAWKMEIPLITFVFGVNFFEFCLLRL